MKTSRAIANVDSATAMLSAIGAYLHGTNLPALGVVPPRAVPFVKPLSFSQLDTSLHEARQRYLVQWLELQLDGANQVERTA